MSRVCYLDDVIIPSSSIEEHCSRLSAVLARFRAHDLRVKAAKCKFGATKVLFLGLIVSRQGIHTDPHKIRAISKLA